MAEAKVVITEGQLKRTITDFLEVRQAQGKLVYFRLNAGDFIEVRGDTRRRVKGAPKGTADLIVIKGRPVPVTSFVISVPDCRVIFIELKAGKGRWSPEQRAFKIIIEAQGAEYHIVRNFEELQPILEGL